MKTISLLFVLALCISCSTTTKCVETKNKKCKAKVEFSETVDPFQKFDRYDRR